jgi:hypothetical protein
MYLYGIGSSSRGYMIRRIDGKNDYNHVFRVVSEAGSDIRTISFRSTSLESCGASSGGGFTLVFQQNSRVHAGFGLAQAKPQGSETGCNIHPLIAVFGMPDKAETFDWHAVCQDEVLSNQAKARAKASEERLLRSTDEDPLVDFNCPLASKVRADRSKAAS